MRLIIISIKSIEYIICRHVLSGVSSLAVKAGAGTRRLEIVELQETPIVSRQTRTGSVELGDVTKVRFQKFSLEILHSAKCCVLSSITHYPEFTKVRFTKFLLEIFHSAIISSNVL